MLINCAHIICHSKITLEQRNEDYLCSLIGICFFWKTLKRNKSGAKLKTKEEMDGGGDSSSHDPSILVSYPHTQKPIMINNFWMLQR